MSEVVTKLKQGQNLSFEDGKSLFSNLMEGKHEETQIIEILEALIKNKKFYVQAGAGIVADSKPEKEYAETVNKAKALMRAVD